MPVQPTHPGVYIQEVSSGVRIITGVATSITAFVGRSLKGELDTAITITSFSDFQTLFGGMWSKSMMSYAVKDFYTNGGKKAVIVRIAKEAKKAVLKIPVAASPIDFLVLEAASEGDWGNNLTVSINHQTKDPSNINLFNIIISENTTEGGVEKFLNVSVLKDDARFVARVLTQSSMLVRVVGDMVPSSRPLQTIPQLTSPPSSPPSQAPKIVDVPITVQAAGKGADGVDVTSNEFSGDESKKTGFYALENEEFNLLCVPPPTRETDVDPNVYVDALTLCVSKRAMLLVDAPAAWGDVQAPVLAVNNAITKLSDLHLSISDAKNAALFFPRIRQSDPQLDGQIQTLAACGMIAGIMARTDTSRGVWKSPAGIDASLNGIDGLQINLSDEQNGQLNQLGINVLRSFPVIGQVVWGSRTLRGADILADEYKYIAVRRTALFLEESLYRGTQWVVFEPNDESLWAQIRLNVGAFMQNLFRQGAFQGKTPKEAYLVKCDSETTNQTDINSGIVNVVVGFAPLKPAEFVIINIQQLAGQIDT